MSQAQFHAPLPDGFNSHDINSMKEYMAELMSLLKRHVLIHTSHPDRFFEIVAQKRISRLPDALESELLGNPQIVQTAVDEITALCYSFSEEFTARGTRLQSYAAANGTSLSDDGQLPLTYEELPSLIHKGPSRSGILKDFFDATERLKLKRRHADFPRPIDTLFPERSAQQEEVCPKQDEDEDADERTRIRSAILGKGMCTKKKHEVIIMDDTIREILAETQKPTGSSGLTVMNVGEGKGYVSRVLSICEGAPVVGVDCNPLHKEAALERLEPILEVANATPNQSKQIVNLNYTNRGRTTCVTCRVGPETDWAGVLRGCVPICDSDGTVICADEAGDENAFGLTSLSSATFGGISSGLQTKVTCKACSKILRCQNTAGVVKHARQHADRVAFKLSQSEDITEGEKIYAEFAQWVETLNPEQLFVKVQSELFSLFIDPSAEKRLRTDVTGENISGVNDTQKSLFDRATDVIVTERVAVAKSQRGQEKCDEKTLIVGDTEVEAVDQKREIERRMTILGYDDNTRKYKVFVHEGDAKRRIRNGVASGKNMMMTLTGEDVISTEALVPLQPIVHPVAVPSLSSVVLMGLHTCGDLGAAICRLYRSTDAPSVVLVSCCWHALTAEGFPLCSMLKSDSQFTTNSLSLLLATQPLEAFVNSSSDEHHGSSRLLFFRSLFALIWEDIREQCAIPNELGGDIVSSYNFSKARPVLERSFLRALAKDKQTMTFTQFCQRIRDELMSSDEFQLKTAKMLCGNGDKDQVNSVGKLKQYLFGNAANGDDNSRYMAKASEFDGAYFNRYFASFVGFTTLRMWMSHLLEALLLMDRFLFLCETAQNNERISLVPLFDGALSPRLFAILGIKR